MVSNFPSTSNEELFSSAEKPFYIGLKVSYYCCQKRLEDFKGEVCLRSSIFFKFWQKLQAPVLHEPFTIKEHMLLNVTQTSSYQIPCFQTYCFQSSCIQTFVCFQTSRNGTFCNWTSCVYLNILFLNVSLINFCIQTSCFRTSSN